MPTDHSILRLRPSDAHRWLVCRASPGYVVQNAHRIVERVEDYTQEGVQAHELGAGHLLGKPFPYDVPTDMKTHLEAYKEFVNNSKLAVPGIVKMLVEVAVNVFYYPGKKGYVDCALIFLKKDRKTVHRIHIIDLKYGRGVSVEALRNPQLSSYAFGLIKDLEGTYSFHDDTEVVITIWQPRVQGEETERTWATTMFDLAVFCTEIATVASQIRANPFKQPFAPSDDGCTFCPAYEFCDARTRWLLGDVIEAEVIDLTPAVLESPLAAPLPELPEPASLSPKQLSRILKVAPLLSKWLEKTEKYVAASMLQHGVKYDDFKVVATRPHRKWREPAEAQEFLAALLGQDVVAPRSLITPAQALELLKTLDKTQRDDILEMLYPMIYQPEGQPTIAPASDKRLEWQDVKVEEEFPDGSVSDEDQSLL